jgi:uncharacterized protein (UPF0548 family)
MQLSYPEIGATRNDELPDGYRHVRRHVRLGTGEPAFRAVAEALARFDVQRGAGLRVRASAGTAAVEVRVASGIGIGPFRLWAPCAIVWVVDEPDRYGYGYGTLAGHPETGEEGFVVSLDADGAVWFDIRAFSRLSRRYLKLAGPIPAMLQDRVTNRYVAAARRIATATA